MQITRTDIEGVLIVEPKRFGDERGVFCETFKAPVLAEAGFDLPFVQDNCARSGPRGVVRGLHMQRAPHAQDKLVRCSRGRIFDVAVDCRPGSPTFGRHVGLELSAANWLQLLVPKGFAHGYATLEEDCEVLYKVTAPYTPAEEEGLLWSDPALGIDWGVSPMEATVNARDQAWPTLAEWSAGRG
ncbi:MAG: dTDP-4-dehydrorhamnose 3,5-epimerase [Caulobacteraceae bacterium]|nr:dTDP-4-dehydrorhamnose 3,5-epimerase [Caulobacter sp.]